jgi:hypothetical protein
MTLATAAESPPVQPRTTRADVERDAARTKATVDQVVVMLSLQPPNSPCRNATPLYSGLYVPVNLFPGKRIHIYAHPWSRGWSIFADEEARPKPVPVPMGLPGAHSWRHVSRQYTGLQRPLYCPRDRTGPWHVPPEQIVEAIIDITDHLARLDRIRRARFRKRHWYFANSLERKEDNSDADR